MAYLDGELPVERAALVATHLEQCAECRAWVVDSRVLSERLTAWQVEPAPPSLTEHVTAAIPAGEIKPEATDINLPSRPRFPQFAIPNWVWATAGAVCLFLMIVAVSIPNLLRSRIAANQSGRSWQVEGGAGAGGAPAPPAAVDKYWGGLSQAAGPLASMTANRGRRDLSNYKKWLAQGAAANAGPGAREVGSPIAALMIVRTASLTLLTKDFDKTRAALEDVVRRHRGYSAQLTVGSESGSAHKLSATFRVPVDQLDAAIAEIKQLAHVEQESQGGEEVTEQYVDLNARLSNAQRTEQTLLDILQKRTGMLSDVLAVEQELARVREEIERMEAELKNLQNRVSFSTLQVELREEYQAQIEIPHSLGGRLWNAVVEGYRTAVDSLVGVVMFLLNVGPFLLLWALILFFPARYVWRRVRAALAPK
jgi:anti-sigma factor RsiW/uncharacterized small protein (DUF1192 family)